MYLSRFIVCFICINFWVSTWLYTYIAVESLSNETLRVPGCIMDKTRKIKLGIVQCEIILNVNHSMGKRFYVRHSLSITRRSLREDKSRCRKILQVPLKPGRALLYPLSPCQLVASFRHDEIVSFICTSDFPILRVGILQLWIPQEC